MKRLKRRSRADTHVSEARAPRERSWDRIIYLTLLVLFFGGVANYIFGDRILLRADGLVLRDRSEIGAIGLVQITQVAVRPGQVVRKGDLLARAESLETLVALAELTMRDAELAERSARLQAELATAKDLEPRAEARLNDLSTERARYRGMERSARPTSSRLLDLTGELHDAEVRLATLRSRIEGLTQEIEALAERRGHARASVQQLEAWYNGGNHYAARDSTVGDTVPATGEVLNPGEAILTLHWGQPYVLAYLPQTYLFGVDVGDRVVIRAGRITRMGRIGAILPMSTGIPDEFRTAFKHRETRQLARIVMEAGPEIPTRASVRITTDWRTTVSRSVDGWWSALSRATPDEVAAASPLSPR